jgi:UDP-2-acetamido-3-amino-2,3-dideoxy-glucuronate N-acetyltransferase
MKTHSVLQPKPRKSASICVAGCGHWGRNLVRNFHALGHLGAICETHPAALEKFAAEYSGVRGYASFTEALEDPEIDAVALATPAEMHHAMALEALRAGKDVFVEKPLALDVEEGQEIIETAAERGAVLMVGHLLRYHPAVLKIQEIIASGALGRLEYIYSNRLSMGKIRHEENALWSFAPHDISVILALAGQVPVQVAATGGAYFQPNIADVTVSTLLFANGARSHIFVSWLHPYKEQRLVVIGSKQMVVFEDTRPTDKLMSFDKRIEWRNGSIEAAKPVGTPIHFDPAEPLGRECAHFVDCVLERRAPVTNGEEGLRVLQVLQACQRSLQMNGEPVEVTSRGMRKLVAI